MKIYGLTTLAEARSAITLGTEVIGVVFAMTKRQLVADQAPLTSHPRTRLADPDRRSGGIKISYQ
jgi:phosphoribosylanthranilate isomerase